MNNEEQGKEGEKKAYHLLKSMGYYNIQSPDWLAGKNGEWIIFEVKNKNRYTNPDAQGLNKRQFYLRQQLFNKTGLRTYLLIFEPDTTEIYGQYLDVLEKCESFETKKGEIKMWELKHYNRLDKVGLL